MLANRSKLLVFGLTSTRVSWKSQYISEEDCNVLYRHLKEKQISQLLSTFGDLINENKIPTHKSCKMVIRGLTETNRTNDALNFYESLKEHIKPTSSLFSTLFTGLINEKQYKKALSFVLSLEKDQSINELINYDLFINKLLEKKEILTVEILINKLSNILPISAYNNLIQYYANSGNLIDSYEIIQKCIRETEVEITPATFGKWIRNFTQTKGYSKEAKNLLLQMINMQLSPNVMTFSKVVNSLIQDKKFEEMFECLDILNEEKIVENEVLFTGMINLCLKQGDLKIADQLLEKMRYLKINPNVVTYTGIISGLAKQNQISRALEYFEEMKNKGVAPNQVTFNVLLNIFASSGDLKEFLYLKDEMTKYSLYPDKVTYSVQMKALLINNKQNNVDRNKNYESAKKLLLEMKSNQIEIDSTICNQVIESILENYSDFSQVNYFFDDIKTLGVSCDTITYNILLKWLIDNNNVSQAKDLLYEMKMKKIAFNSTSFVEICRIFEKSKENIELLKYFHDLKANYSSLLDSNLMLCFISSLVNCNDVDNANELLKSSKSINPNIYMYSKIIDGFLKQNRHLDALQSFNELKSLKIKPDIVLYNSLIHGFIASNQQDMALKFFNEIRQNSINPSIETFNFIIQGFLKEKNIASALDFWDRLHQIGLRPNQYTYRLFSTLNRKSDDDKLPSSIIELRIKKEQIPMSSHTTRLLQKLRAENR